METKDNRPLKCGECGSTENHIQIKEGIFCDYHQAVCDDCGHRHTIEEHERQQEFSGKTYKKEIYRMF